MKIIAISDIHGRIDLLDELKEVVLRESVDVIVVSGDIVGGKARGTEWFSAQLEGREPVWHKREIREEEVAEADTYSRFFSKANELGVPVLVVPGNMDAPRERFTNAVAEAEGRHENVHVIHNSEFRWDGFIFRGFGGEVTEELREDRFVQRFRRIDINGHMFCEVENLILVTHSPPVGQRVSKEGTKEKGSPVVNDLLESSGAFLLFCGHAHMPEVEELHGAFVVNPGPLKGQNYAIVEVQGRGKVVVKHCKIA